MEELSAVQQNQLPRLSVNKLADYATNLRGSGRSNPPGYPTGDVYFPPSVATISSPPDADDEEMIQSREDSRLLIVVGEVNQKKGKYYFEWANHRLKLIRAILKQ